MFSLGAAALSEILSTRYGWLIIPISFGLAIYLTLLSVQETQRIKDRNQAARDLWLAECGKPIEVCAASWDSGWTLRELYRDRVAE